MDYSLFLASYVAASGDRQRRNRMRAEQQYFLDHADVEARDILRRAVVAIAIISLSFTSLVVATDTTGADIVQESVLQS